MTFIIYAIGIASLIAFSWGATMLWIDSRTDQKGTYRDGEAD